MSLFGSAEVGRRDRAEALRFRRLLLLEVVDLRREFVLPSFACFGVCCRSRQDEFVIASHGCGLLLQC